MIILFLCPQPAVSIGNVGQLATDLVVSALAPSRHLIGNLHDASILPVVGNDAFAKPGHESGQLNTSAEGSYFIVLKSYHRSRSGKY